MFGGKSPAPPPPPPPPPNPPAYASAFQAPPASGAGALGAGGGIFSNAILTSPMGAADQRATQRKQLFGQ